MTLQDTVKALYDLNPKGSGQMTLKRGDVITVIFRREPNWWLGAITDQDLFLRGLFPTNYVA
jgi:hypothetical protein